MLTTILKDNTPIRFRASGKGEALVFLHGHLENLEIWDTFVKLFDNKNRTICIDLPGHGGTGLFSSVSKMELMAETVKYVLDYLDIPKAVIFGHSMGGYTALAALEKYPEMFKAISLFHSHTLPDSEEVAQKRDREISVIEKGLKRLLVNQNIPNMYATDRLEELEGAVDMSKHIAHSLSDEGVIAAIKGLKSRPDRSEILENARVPCLNIIGKKDNYIPFEEVSMKTVLPDGSERLILEQSGHMGFIEEAQVAYEGITQFLNNIG